MNGKINEQRALLKKLVASGATKEEIMKARGALRDLVSKSRTLSGKVNLLSSERRTLKRVIEDLETNRKRTERYLSSIPSQISQTKSQIASFQAKIQTKKSHLKNANAQVPRLDSDISRLRATKRSIKATISNIQVEMNVHQTNIKALSQRKRALGQKLSVQIDTKNSLITSVRELSNYIDQTTRDIPDLEREVYESQSTLSSTRKSLNSLRSEEELKRIDIAQLQNEILNLKERKSLAYDEYKKRDRLYDHYNYEAQSLGSSQVLIADQLGTEKGQEIADLLSEKFSKLLVQQLGEQKAKLYADVRGEIKGYSNGYTRGVNSESSISQGQVEGMLDAKKNSNQYAQNVLRPQFFEGFLLNAFKDILPINTAKNSFLTNMELPEQVSILELAAFDSNDSSIQGLTEEEILESQGRQTSLDAIIDQLFTDDIQLNKRLTRYKRASGAYSAPKSVPYTQVDCSAVYKGLSVFKASCRDSFRSDFEGQFMQASKNEFTVLYPNQFIDLYTPRFNSVLEQAYDEQFDFAYATSFKEAEAVGKKDAHDRSYASSYEKAYAINLPIETAKAKEEAKVDLSTWSISNPLVTVSSIKIDKNFLRGGESANVIVTLKNISHVASMNTGDLKLTNSSNILMTKQHYKLIQVPAKGIATFVIPFTINPLASSKESIFVDAAFSLPKDRYKNVRIEKYRLDKSLSKNPKLKSSISFNSTPKVKGFRKYYLHSFDFDLTSLAENLEAGYDVSLEALDGAQRYLRFKRNNLNSGKTIKGQALKTSVTYVFKKSAKKRKLRFKATVKYKSEVLFSHTIDMTPR